MEPSVVLGLVSGQTIDLLDPRPSDIVLSDVANALSMICRFNGQVNSFYSVAEHAVRVALEVHRKTDDRKLVLAALHHDSHEAYIGDLTSPMKRLIGKGYINKLADKFNMAIGTAFDFDPGLIHAPVVVAADLDLLAIEARSVQSGTWPGPGPRLSYGFGWRPDIAAREFVAMHESLGGSYQLFDVTGSPYQLLGEQ